MNLTPTEEQEQRALVEYLDCRNLKYTAIPNSTFTPYKTTKMRNTRMWVRPWFPDIVVLVKWHFIAIELKRKKWWTVSRYQKEWIAELNKCNWVEAYVAYWADEAIKIIESKF